MIYKINDSKTAYFIWLTVIVVLFAGFTYLVFWFFNHPEIKSEITPADEKIIGILKLAVPYVLATFPLGWTVRRRIMRKYLHVPTEDIRIFETNVVVAFWRLVVCEIVFLIDVVLFVLYFAFSIIFGVLFTPYFIISGIILMITKRI